MGLMMKNGGMLTAATEYASVPRRFGAYLIDHMVTTLLMTPLLVWYAKGLFGERSGVYLLGYATFFFIGIVLLRMAYLILCWHTTRGTVGCRILHIVVHSKEGEPLSICRSFIRFLGLGLSTLLFGLGWLPMLFTRKHQGIHDLIASTVVVMDR